MSSVAKYQRVRSARFVCACNENRFVLGGWTMVKLRARRIWDFIRIESCTTLQYEYLRMFTCIRTARSLADRRTRRSTIPIYLKYTYAVGRDEKRFFENRISNRRYDFGLRGLDVHHFSIIYGEHTFPFNVSPIEVHHAL